MQSKASFQVPDEKKRLAAIGSLEGTSHLHSEAIKAIIPLFKSIPKPNSSDWLAEHKESGQTFEGYTKGCHNKVTENRKTIYIQPLEDTIDKEFLDTLKLFILSYYKGMKVEIKEMLNVREIGVESRINDYSKRLQYNAGQILKRIEEHVPNDAYCLIAVCMTDLYPRDAWNFVFGLASLQKRTGVFSFARYDENFFAEPNEEVVPTDKSTIIWKSCKVMVHEIGHMFGLLHCVYYHCIMNGSNHLEESNKKPMELCPVCLRKLQKAVGFNIAERYQELSKVCEIIGKDFKNGAQWYQTAYEAVMKRYGTEYQKYIEEEKTQENKQSNPIQKKSIKSSTISKQQIKKVISTQKPVLQKSVNAKQPSIIEAKIKIDDHIDLYKNL